MFTMSSAPPAACVSDRAGRAPRVLADRDADAHPGHDEQRTVDGRRLEVALLVEHRVVGQQVLAVDAEHTPVRADRGGVVQIAIRLGEARPPRPRGRCAPRSCRASRRPAATNGGPQEQVFRRVAGDRELGKRDEVAPGRFGLVVGVEDARRVALEIADDEVELRRGEAESWHRHQDTRHCRDGRRAKRVARRCRRSSPRIDRSGRRADRRGRCVGARRRRASARSPTSSRAATSCCATAWSRWRARRDRCRPRSSPTRRCSIRSAIADAFRPRARTDDGYRAPRGVPVEPADDARALRRWKRREFLRIAARDLLGARRPPRRGARARRARAGRAWRPRSRSPGADGHPVRDHRDGQARRSRAQLRQRRRRALRPRRRRRAKPNASARSLLATMTTPDRGRHRVPHRRQPASRGPRRAAVAHPRQLRGVLRELGAARGSSRRCSRRAPSPVTPRSATASWSSSRPYVWPERPRARTRCERSAR